ncbi:MAG: hypothetical protein NTZ33_01700 [Bacteroidetes bacterium]|nr:hypothetical protein [Bacteroidota bacterium]
MKQLKYHQIILISILIFLLNGCIPYTSNYPIAGKGKEKIDGRLIGEWNLKSELGIYKIFIAPFNDTIWIGSYYRLYEKNNQMTNMNTAYGFNTKINDILYLNVQAVFGDTLTKGKFVFFKYNIISKDSIELFFLSGLKFDTKFDSSKDLEDFITSNQDSVKLLFDRAGIATRDIPDETDPPVTSLAQSMDFMSPTIFPDEVKEAFSLNKNKINDAKHYFKSILPEKINIYVEFKDYQKIDFWVFKTKGENLEKIIEVWDADIYNNEIQKVLKQLNWNAYELIILREKLYHANCISISNLKNAIEVGYKRSGMGKYSFDLFETPIPAENWEKYNDSCMYIMIDNLNVLEYGGPAFGSQCMPKR